MTMIISRRLNTDKELNLGKVSTVDCYVDALSRIFIIHRRLTKTQDTAYYKINNCHFVLCDKWQSRIK